MLDVVLTLDYEIHGNGQGSPRALMVEPTRRLLDRLDSHGARLTIMADVGEILRFRRHLQETGRDDFAYGDIAAQLRGAVRTGHDVQLHVHPAYLNATLVGGKWRLDWSEYDLARLPYPRIDEIVREGKAFLERLLRPVDSSYACVASRSANWSMQPSAALVRALLANGIRVDTSIFKHGRRDGLVRFDYRHAASPLVPWRVDPRDACRAHPDGELLEFPIYAEARRLPRFVSATRVQRALAGRRHPVPAGPPGARAGGVRSRPRPGRLGRAVALAAAHHAWKLDFNQCSGRQLVAGLERAAARHDRPGRALPVVLIGHSKLYTPLNERGLERFLAHVAAHPERFRFATLRDALARADCFVGDGG